MYLVLYVFQALVLSKEYFIDMNLSCSATIHKKCIFSRKFMSFFYLRVHFRKELIEYKHNLVCGKLNLLEDYVFEN